VFIPVILYSVELPGEVKLIDVVNVNPVLPSGFKFDAIVAVVGLILSM
jgi:hypothetical protein